jgi:hypothetical protein
MDHAYCAYFDHNYLPRALLTFSSLRRFDTASTIYVLALSKLCETIMHELALPKVKVIPLATLEKAYPELETAKPTRSRTEYIFTLTPFLPHYVLTIAPSIKRVTYMDADFFFFSSPEPLLNATRTASVAITPHRFSPLYPEHIKFGRFNVGWITYRRCAEGYECLNTYRVECAAWCYDRLEDARFGDQLYLDAWPKRYRSLKIIEHKGVNLASYNVDNYQIREQGANLMVDDEPLVFFHYNNITPLPDGSIHAYLPPSSRHIGNSVLYRHVLHPYAVEYQLARAALYRRFPELARVKCIEHRKLVDASKLGSRPD